MRMATSAIDDLTHKHGQRLGTLRLLLLLSVNNADKGVKPAAFDKRLAMMWAFARDVQHSLRGGNEADQGLASVDGPQGSADAREALHVDLGLAKMPYFHEKSAALAESDFYEGTDDGVAETEQVFLVGYDTLIRIFNPKYYGAPAESATQLAGPESSPMWEALGPLFGRAKLRVIMRTGDEWGDEEQQRAYLVDLLKAEGLGTVLGSKGLGSRIEMVEGRKVGEDVISSTLARAAAKARDGDRLGSMVTAGVRWWIEQDDLYTEP
jgi:nicotinamide-nucleotide adenylyltransferase